MTKFLFFGSFLATTCAVVQGAVVNNLSEDLTGVVLNPGHPDAELSEPFIGWFADTKEILNACAHDGVGTVCDVYLNIHTEFSYFLNPSAFGCNRAQLVVKEIEENGIIYFGIDGKATSSNMNEVMKICEDANCLEEKYDITDINYLPSRSDLGGDEKEACSGFNFEMTLDPNDDDELVVKKLFIRLESLDTLDTWKAISPGTETYTNDVIIGVHLHLGPSGVDGPPSVVFCGSPDGATLPRSFITCEDIQ